MMNPKKNTPITHIPDIQAIIGISTAAILVPSGLNSRSQTAPFVAGCHIITGQWDFVIEVVAKEMDSLGDSILDNLSKIEGIGHTQTMVSFYSYRGAARGS